jgi:hypothetical protein
MHTPSKSTALKTLLAVLSILLLATVGRSFGMMGIRPVNKVEAKELGIEVRLQDNGPAVWVELELKTDTKVKDYDHVSLEIRDGEKFLLGYDALKEKKSSTGALVVTFLVDRNYLEKVTLTVVAGQPGNFSGYELHLKDFTDAPKR